MNSEVVVRVQVFLPMNERHGDVWRHSEEILKDTFSSYYRSMNVGAFISNYYLGSETSKAVFLVHQPSDSIETVRDNHAWPRMSGLALVPRVKSGSLRQKIPFFLFHTRVIEHTSIV